MQRRHDFSLKTKLNPSRFRHEDASSSHVNKNAWFQNCSLLTHSCLTENTHYIFNFQYMSLEIIVKYLGVLLFGTASFTQSFRVAHESVMLGHPPAAMAKPKLQ